MYPNDLREAGYCCLNPGKEDYNLEKTGQVTALQASEAIYEIIGSRLMADKTQPLAIADHARTSSCHLTAALLQIFSIACRDARPRSRR